MENSTPDNQSSTYTQYKFLYGTRTELGTSSTKVCPSHAISSRIIEAITMGEHLVNQLSESDITIIEDRKNIPRNIENPRP